MKSLRYVHRFPTLQENIQTYAVVAVPVYTWTILWLFWELPSWLNFLAIDEILPIFAYALTTNLLESVLILAGLNLFCFILPGHWFRDLFVVRSALFILPALACLMYYASLFGKEVDPPASLLLWSPVVLLVFFMLSLFLSRISLVKTLAESLADRLTVFLYLLFPLSLLSLLFVLVRNAG